MVDPETELDFLHDLPVELMWGVGPATMARLAAAGVHPIGQLANMPGSSLERIVGRAAGDKLSALAWNRILGLSRSVPDEFRALAEKDL